MFPCWLFSNYEKAPDRRWPWRWWPGCRLRRTTDVVPFLVVPVWLRSMELPATTVGEWRRRHSLRCHKAGAFLLMTTTHDRSGHCRFFFTLADQGLRAPHAAARTAHVRPSLPPPRPTPPESRRHAEKTRGAESTCLVCRWVQTITARTRWFANNSGDERALHGGNVVSAPNGSPLVSETRRVSSQCAEPAHGKYARRAAGREVDLRTRAERLRWWLVLRWGEIASPWRSNATSLSAPPRKS